MPAASVVWAGSAIGAGQDSMSMTTWPEPLREIQKTLPGVKPSALSSATWYLFCSAPAANAVQFTPRLSAADVPPVPDTVAVTSGFDAPGQSRSALFRPSRTAESPVVVAPSWWAVSRAVSVTPSGSTPLSEPSVAVVSPFTQSVPPPLTQVPRSDAPAETTASPAVLAAEASTSTTSSAASVSADTAVTVVKPSEEAVSVPVSGESAGLTTPSRRHGEGGRVAK